jgi:transmembrane sensor
MTEIERGDTVWQQAMDWIMREHEGLLDDVTRQELQHWLVAAPAHGQAYEQARTLWLITGLVPTADEQSDSPAGDD